MLTPDKIFLVVAVLAAVGSGLIGGVFFIFSTTIMRAFSRLSPVEGIAAMNMINVVIINPMFLGVFLGTGVLCAVLGVVSIVGWQQTGSGWMLAGALLYLIGSLAVTMIFNVPRNNALAAADATSGEGQKVWTDYLRNWTFWNHVRTIASVAASATFAIALALQN